MPATYTPVRYPGGKSKIYPEFRAILERNGLIGASYAEVFAGGAGLAIKLLLRSDVSSIVINDYDRAVFCMWDAIVNNSDEMCSFVNDVDLDVKTWKKQREIYRKRETADPLELAKATFYLNRTNVSGILGGGLIGGLDQKGAYKMGARFTRDTLIKKIENIADRKDDIEVSQLDAEVFIDRYLQNKGLFAYLDPPYVQKGPGLYRDSFDEAKHRSLAKKLGNCKSKWVVTYDKDILIDSIYDQYESTSIDIAYTANARTVGKEKIILGPGLSWPETLVRN
ncbi:DNA methyltransferase [Adlercreutzia equolifaciens subsp. celatus]|uniref:site-specific DNA-methyltransferase (adenine-specific) n=1 Tax=Adlercreutzia equolifaciens subsp. celatus DSM 18785 TaxID=1121021 RepID=A0A3N0AMB6_9ACTN|nr:DNA adenine methylase [Adlercreutzia equolifaciens]MCP2078784.1 DNA adenine methylase [Adlercreutzia equolifaciens subsp. celatus DSM 18785]RFT90916.1 DNA adenine methylase [Adlercreutzia equolifaciens subsp. celatus]RNL35581.1 DNA methyltransferase [Adlercreutzia equolifaciens subsp. celatus DSM 18785]BCS56802.1 DNA methyltransferase [Adlercreutzia equolifaciens subsp. celatus]